MHSNLYGSSSCKMTGTAYTIIVLYSVKMGRIVLKWQLKASEIWQSKKGPYSLKTEAVQSFEILDTTSWKYKIVRIIGWHLEPSLFLRPPPPPNGIRR